jgi:hypothetical protein
MSSSDARGVDPLVGKSPLVVTVSPQLNGLASSDGVSKITGAGENQSAMPEGGLLSSATVTRSDVQAGCGSLPVENRVDIQADTNRNHQRNEQWQDVIEEQGQISTTVALKIQKETIRKPG